MGEGAYLDLLIRDDFIKLGQAMKLSGLTGSGADAKMLIQGGEVLVNGKVELQRGKKLYPGDVFAYKDQSRRIQKREI